LDGYTPSASDPAVHIEAVQKLFDSGVTIVNVHSGQADQKKVIDSTAIQCRRRSELSRRSQTAGFAPPAPQRFRAPDPNSRNQGRVAAL
jgi:hypothetical protein